MNGAAGAPAGWRQRSLRWFVALTVAVTAVRLLATIFFLLFGPGVGGAPQHATTQVFFLLSKSFLGGLFWPISLAIEGWRDPLAWVFYPW